MTPAEVGRRIRETGVIPVVRAPSAAEALRIVEALRAGGLRVVELTLTVPDAPRVISQLAQSHADLLVGAGSVLDAGAARACLDAGARFVVSPVLDPAIVALCHAQRAVAIPGALTPNEILAASRAGADFVKVFPVDAVGGARYIRSLKAPMPQLELIPTGGVTLDTVASFIEAGAAAVGVGAELAQGPSERITAAARRFADIAGAARRAA